MSISYHTNGGQNLLGEGDHEAAEQAEEALGALAGVVGLDGHAHLHHAPAQDDDTQGPDNGENKVAQIVHDGQRVAGAAGSGQGRDRQHGEGQDQGRPEAREPALLSGKSVLHVEIPPSYPPRSSTSSREVNVKSRSPAL